MLFVFESKRRFRAGEPRLRVLSGPEVQGKLKTHRLNEMLSLFSPVREGRINKTIAKTAFPSDLKTVF